jgi:hypothetical protein
MKLNNSPLNKTPICQSNIKMMMTAPPDQEKLEANRQKRCHPYTMETETQAPTSEQKKTRILVANRSTTKKITWAYITRSDDKKKVFRNIKKSL